jgi:purine-cytosine permease-like protein
MSDTPSGDQGSEPGAYEPSGARRSTYTPPPPGTPAPTWDDDALAAAMEEEVRTYTSPITLPVLSAMTADEPAPPVPAPAPVAAEPGPSAPFPAPESAPAPVPLPLATPAPEPVAAPAPAPAAAPAPEPMDPPAPVPASTAAEPEQPSEAFSAPGYYPPPAPPPFAAAPAAPFSADPAAPSTAEPAPAPASEVAPTADAVDDAQLIRDLEGASTTDAMRRLEDELRRRATGPTPIVPVESFFDGEPPVSPPAPGPDPEPDEKEPFSALFTAPLPIITPATTPVAATIAPVDVEPLQVADPEQPDPVVPVPAAEDAAAPPTPIVEGWRAAPPPDFAPPPLVAPPSLHDAAVVPPPTELPDVARRAELPPPPGYAEDGTPEPAGSVDAVAAPVEDGAPAEPAPPGGPELAVDWNELLVAAAGAGIPAEPLSAVETGAIVDPSPQALAEPDPAAEIAPATEAAAVPAVDAPVAAPAVPSVEPAVYPPVTGPEPLPEPEPRAPGALAIENVGLGPTPRDQRAGRAARLFWLWFAANASVVSVALGGVMLGAGMSLRQAIVATVVGIALSFIPLGFGTLAGRWNAQPTIVVSRAAFGVTGNIVPAVLAALVRVFWGGVLLWLLGDALGRVLVDAHADLGLGVDGWSYIGVAVGAVLAGLVAMVGYGLLARVQLVLSIAAGVVIVLAAVVTLPRVRLDAALQLQDGPWILVVGGAVLVFSFVGLVWAQAGADLARYQRGGGSGASSMLWATFGATIPPFLLIVWGALLAASDPSLGAALQQNPLLALASLLPSWFPAPVLVAAAVGLLSGSVLSLYSGGFAIQAVIPVLSRIPAVLVAAILALAAAGALVLLGVDSRAIVKDLAVTLAVPVAAWAGVFAAEMMIRNRRFHTPSLLMRGGVYPTVRWVNLVGLVVISAVGYGFVVSGQHWLAWQGWGWRLLGVRAGDALAFSDLGVLGALVLGILLPIATAIPTIRRQESTEAGTDPARI